MAAFVFPSSPTTGDVAYDNGVAYQWNGTGWVVYKPVFSLTYPASAIDCGLSNGADSVFTFSATTPSVLNVASGGTGLSSLTAGYIPFGSGTNAFGSNSNLFWDNTNNQLQIAAGTALLPALFPVGDANTGVWFPAADTVAVSTGGSERMRITAAGDVGIGTSSPSGKLHVSGGISFLSGGLAVQGGVPPSTGAGLESWYDGTNVLLQTYSRTSSAWLPLITAGSPLVYWTDGSERMRITSAGDVGIGTSSPSARLHVYKNGGASPSAYAAMIQQDSSTGANTDSNSLLYFYGYNGSNVRSWLIGVGSNSKFGAHDNFGIYDSTVSATRLVVDVSGNLGLGTSSFGTSAATVLAIATGTAPTTGPADTIQIFSTDLSAGNTILSLRTEGTPVNANTTAAATHRIAIRVNGTVYYLLANTAA